MSDENPTFARLQQQIAWYDRKSLVNQRYFKWLKVTEIIAAAAIPFAAGFKIPTWITGGLGAVIVVLEGLQSINQFQQQWITFRSTCEELKHEKYLWLAKAGPYTQKEKSNAVFAERVESLISREHAKWVATREHAEDAQKAAQT